MTLLTYCKGDEKSVSSKITVGKVAKMRNFYFATTAATWTNEEDRAAALYTKMGQMLSLNHDPEEDFKKVVSDSDHYTDDEDHEEEEDSESYASGEEDEASS